MKTTYNVEKYLILETKTRICSDEFEALLDEIGMYGDMQ